MEFLKGWTSAIAGTIIFTALCEIIVPDGNMKKYVRMCLGMLVMITLIKPLSNINLNSFTENLFDYDKTLAYSQQKNYTKEERELIKELYQGKIEGKIKETLEKKINAEITARVDAETKAEENFGEILSLYIIVSQKDGFWDYADEIKKILKEDFGISEDKVTLKFKKG